MKILIVIALIFTINWIECTLKVTDFCKKLEIDRNEKECKGNYSLNCGSILCAKDKYSCQSIRFLNGIKSIQKNEKDYLFFQNNFEALMKLIKYCPKLPNYKWNPNDVCFKDCFQISFWRIWSNLLNVGECKCRGKYNFRCNTAYCALDKRACDELKKAKQSKITKCLN
jgi:hypothetical protein